MSPLTKSKLLNFSVILSLVSICTTIFINYKIAKEFLRVHGKTRALFGITEVLQFGYQYYVSIVAIISLILTVIGLTSNDKPIKKIISLLLSLIAITIIFLRIWGLLV
jgi:hypothetical protein